MFFFVFVSCDFAYTHACMCWLMTVYPCARSDTINNHWGDSPKSMLPIYRELIAAGLRVWVFRSVSR